MSESHASKASLITVLIQRLGPLVRDLTNNRDRVIEIVNTINALTIPRGWIGVDDDGRIHLTRTISGALYALPTAVGFSADIVWNYDSIAGTVTCVKSRDGAFAGTTRLCQHPTFPQEMSTTKMV